MELSDQQKAAVQYIGSPTLVVAGAGSGKTLTLTAKVAYLIEQGYKPEKILAITFTNKAAEEMKQRLVLQTGLPISRFPWVRTFHSACYKILRIHCPLLGYQTPLQVYGTHQQQKVLREILVGKFNFDKKHVPGVLARISNAKNSGNPDRFLEMRPKFHHIPMEDVYERYEKALMSINAVDFDNILMKTRDLLKNYPEIREKYQNYFDFILCDEYQDTNNLQEELTGLFLRNGNLFCVGDDWQAIYSFRGSNISHFLSFKKKFKGAKIFRLEQNYRSADEIVSMANNLIDFNPDKMDKKCFSEKLGGAVEIHAFPDDSEEANWVCRKLAILHEQGIPYEKMAVLYRTKFCSLSFEREFRANRIPFRILGGKGFFERKEILDLTSYLAAAVFPRDDVAFERIMNTPKRGVGPVTVRKLNQIRDSEMSLQDATRKALREKLLTTKLYNALEFVVNLLDDIRDMKPDAALWEIMDRVNYMDHLMEYSRSGSMDFASKDENIQQLIFSASQKETILDYLEEAALVREDTEKAEDKPGGVNLMTIHAAKGLEFPAIFVVACEDQLFPHWKSLNSAAALQEERRLMYVAVTRSEKLLFLSHAGFRKGQVSTRSRFIDELKEALNN